jgi:rubrerythrin
VTAVQQQQEVVRRSSEAVVSFRAEGVHEAAAAAEEQVLKLANAISTREEELAGLLQEAKKQNQAVQALEDMLRCALCQYVMLSSRCHSQLYH